MERIDQKFSNHTTKTNQQNNSFDRYLLNKVQSISNQKKRSAFETISNVVLGLLIEANEAGILPDITEQSRLVKIVLGMQEFTSLAKEYTEMNNSKKTSTDNKRLLKLLTDKLVDDSENASLVRIIVKPEHVFGNLSMTNTAKALYRMVRDNEFQAEIKLQTNNEDGDLILFPKEAKCKKEEKSPKEEFSIMVANANVTDQKSLDELSIILIKKFDKIKLLEIIRTIKIEKAIVGIILIECCSRLGIDSRKSKEYAEYAEFHKTFQNSFFKQVFEYISSWSKDDEYTEGNFNKLRDNILKFIPNLHEEQIFSIIKDSKIENVNMVNIFMNGFRNMGLYSYESPEITSLEVGIFEKKMINLFFEQLFHNYFFIENKRDDLHEHLTEFQYILSRLEDSKLMKLAKNSKGKHKDVISNIQAELQTRLVIATNLMSPEELTELYSKALHLKK